MVYCVLFDVVGRRPLTRQNTIIQCTQAHRRRRRRRPRAMRFRYKLRPQLCVVAQRCWMPARDEDDDPDATEPKRPNTTHLHPASSKRGSKVCIFACVPFHRTSNAPIVLAAPIVNYNNVGSYFACGHSFTCMCPHICSPN